MPPKYANSKQAGDQQERAFTGAVLVTIGWIASCDGSLDEKERLRFDSIAKSSGVTNPADIDAFLTMGVRDQHALKTACTIIRDRCTGDRAKLFMEMAIGMAIADGVLVTTENHVLRFLADLVGFNCQRFNELFRETTGRPLPQPSDLSSGAFWSEARRRSQGHHSQSRQQHSQQNHVDGRIAEAYAVLGLARGASLKEIKQAYRRLAQVHHPDRFSTLGEASVAAATSTFKRIQTAYDLLVKHA